MSRAPPIEKRVFGVNENLCRLVYRLVHRAVDELPPSADARMQVPIRRLSRHKLIVADDARISRLANLFGIVDIYLSLIHISEPTRLGMISYAVFCLKKKKQKQ